APGRLLAPTVAPLSAQPTRRVPLRRRELPPRRSHGAGPGPHGVAQPRRPRAAGLPRAPRRLSGFRGCAEAAVRRLRGGPRADGVRAQGHRRGRGGGAPQLVRVRGPPGGRVLGGGEAAHRGGAGGRVSSRPLGAGGGGAVSRTTAMDADRFPPRAARGTAEGPEAAEGRQANGAARCRGGRGSPAAAAAGSRRPATRTPRSWAPCSPPLDCPPAPR
ncbi:unnamed protein product, partial [Prorocentrum cordatum]